MADTPNLAIPVIEASQAQKHVSVNEGMLALDAIVQLNVVDKDLSAPPGSPAEGDVYIVGASPTGAWAGQANNLAAYQNAAWTFYTPKQGWNAYVKDESVDYLFDGSAWVNTRATLENSLPKFSAHCNFDNTYAAAVSPTWADFLINNEDFDTQNSVGIVSNVATFTAPSDGYYLFGLSGTIINVFGSTGNVDRTQIGLSINGVDPVAQDQASTGFHNFSSRFETVTLTTLLSLSLNDTVNPQILVTGAATENIVIGNAENKFWGHRVF